MGVTVPTRTRRGVGPEIPGLSLEPRPGRASVREKSLSTSARTRATSSATASRIGLAQTCATGCNIYRKKGAEPDYSLIAFDTASPYVDAISGAAVTVSYRVAYRGVRATDEGGSSPEQSVAAGG